mgnify:CR=1 FL=1
MVVAGCGIGGDDYIVVVHMRVAQAREVKGLLVEEGCFVGIGSGGCLVGMAIEIAVNLNHVTAEFHIVGEVALKMDACADEQFVAIFGFVELYDGSNGVNFIIVVARDKCEGEKDRKNGKNIILFHDFFVLKVDTNSGLHIDTRLGHIDATVEVEMVEIGCVEKVAYVE